VTPVGDIEIGIVVRIALRGRTSDLAQLLEAFDKAEAVLIGIVTKPTAAEEQCQNSVIATAGGFSE
jgi:hypothetical protein